MPLIHDKRIHSSGPVQRALVFFFRRFDFLQAAVILLLMGTGILFVWGIGQQVGGISTFFYWQRQLQWGLLGLICWAAFALIDYRKIGIFFLALYPASTLLLILLPLLGTEQFGAKRWLSIGGFSVQPAEFAKFAVIGLMAWLLSRREINVRKFSHVCLLVFLTVLPVFFIAIQPNYGTALVIALCSASILFTAGIRLRYPLILLALLLITAPLGYRYLLRNYHRERIQAFLNLEAHRSGKGWNQIQSKLAVGSGGLTGKGFGKGTQNAYGWLPQTVSNSDFIFSVIGEETGFAGTAGLVALYALLLFSIYRCGMTARDALGRYLCAGTGTMIGIHSCVNIAMNIGLLPVAGLPLPLVSYGGTFMLVTLCTLGILQSVYARRIRPDEKEDL